MGKQYKTLIQNDMDFIKLQKLFYLSSYSAKEVNLSPVYFKKLDDINEDLIREILEESIILNIEAVELKKLRK